MGKTWIDCEYIRNIVLLHEHPEFLAVASPWSEDVEFLKPNENSDDLMYVQVSEPGVWRGLDYALKHESLRNDPFSFSIRMRKNFKLSTGCRICIAPYDWSPSLSSWQVEPGGVYGGRPGESFRLHLLAMRRQSCPADILMMLISWAREKSGDHLDFLSDLVKELTPQVAKGKIA